MKEMKLLCWNVNGIRAVKGKGFLEWLRRESPDILCLQETKADAEGLDADLREPGGYYTYWSRPEKRGYGGVATYTKPRPLSVGYDFASNFGVEGRVVITEYPEFTLFNVYFPNGKQSKARLDYKLEFYNVFLDYIDSLKAKGKKLVVCGDVNTAHREIDLARPKENEKVSGFLPEERAWIDRFIAHGYVDAFRHFHKEPNQYTWWDYKTRARERNVGWRLDYFFVSEGLLPSLADAFIMSEVTGSDHCPIGTILKVG